MNKGGLAATAAAVAAAGLIGGSIWFVTIGAPDDRFANCRTSVVAGGAGSIGGPFTLVSESGQTVTDAEVFTRPSLLYFGYTFCPDVCPTDTSRMAEAVDLLTERGYDIGSVFISVDPDRDTADVMAEYTDYLHPEMLGLTGTPEQIKAAAQAYRAFYAKQESDDEYYLVDHSAFTYLVFPETGFAEFFRRDLTSEQLADQVACFLDIAA